MGACWFHPSVHAAVQYCIRHRAGAATTDEFASSDALETLNATSKSPVAVTAVPLDLQVEMAPSPEIGSSSVGAGSTDGANGNAA